MPSARYTINIKPEDIQPDKPRELTPKEKLANWWHYSWKWVLAGLIVLGVLGLMVKDILWQVKPDYRIAVVTRYDVPEEAADQLSAALTPLGQDLNGDGRVVVQVDAYQMDFTGYVEPTDESAAPASEAPGGDASEDVGAAMNSMNNAYEQVANMTRLTGDVQSRETLIFLVDDPEGFQEVVGCLSSSEGRLPANAASLTGVDLYPWQDCPVLRGLELGSFTDMLGNNPTASETVFNQLYLARRGFAEDKELKEFSAENEAFFYALIQGAAAR